MIVHCHFTLMMMGLCTAYRLWQAKIESDGQGMDQQSRQKEPVSPKEPISEPRPCTPTSLSTAMSPMATLSTALLGGEGTARWRARLKQENRDKVIVFVAHAYGIFHMAELAILMGMRLRELPSQVGTKEAILSRYGLSP